MIRNHLRSNVVGYLALFVALSGTAMATHSGRADTIGSGDIINGQVKTNDISNSNGVRSADVRDDTLDGGGLGVADLGPDSVGRDELQGGAVGTNEIADDAVGSLKIRDAAVGAPEIRDGAVGAAEIATGAVGAPEIATDSVGGAEIGSDVVGPAELGSIHEHRAAEFISDDTAHDGVYAIGAATVSCGANEDLLSVSIDWGDGGADVGHGEKMLANVPVIDRVGTDSATVEGAFDGGGGENDPASFEAVATCIGP